jgi:hypothetical protein
MHEYVLINVERFPGLALNIYLNQSNEQQLYKEASLMKGNKYDFTAELLFELSLTDLNFNSLTHFKFR